MDTVANVPSNVDGSVEDGVIHVGDLTSSLNSSFDDGGTDELQELGITKLNADDRLVYIHLSVIYMCSCV